jgi:hypothetical protein
MVGFAYFIDEDFCLFEGIVNVNLNQRPIIEPCAPDRVFVYSKPKWLHKVQRAGRCCTKPSNIPRIGGNLWFYQNDVERP